MRSSPGISAAFLANRISLRRSLPNVAHPKSPSPGLRNISAESAEILRSSPAGDFCSAEIISPNFHLRRAGGENLRKSQISGRQPYFPYLCIRMKPTTDQA